MLAEGNAEAATDAFEAALAVDPGYIAAYLALGDAARVEGLQGKAIHYYREALERDPDNLLALSGEGGAMVEKGAVEKARRNLAKLEGLCGKGCAEIASAGDEDRRGPDAAGAFGRSGDVRAGGDEELRRALCSGRSFSASSAGGNLQLDDSG